MIINGDSLEELRKLASGSVQCVVTSPPYYGLRDYGVDRQIGIEKTPEEYVNKLVVIFREINRILNDTGTLWLNLGDSYNGSGKGVNADGRPGKSGNISKGNKGTQVGVFAKSNVDGLKDKDLIGVPWMVAFALRNDGWYLRQDIIWSKPNPMPESVKDRCTKSHEYIFLFSKNKKYFYNHEAILQPYTKPMNRWGGDKLVANGRSEWDNDTGQKIYMDRNMRPNPSGKNRRSVWEITTKPFRGAHFAAFPQEIPELCIKAGSKVGDTILDPFLGSGTTAMVAKKLERKFIGIEINSEYVKIAQERLFNSD